MGVCLGGDFVLDGVELLLEDSVVGSGVGCYVFEELEPGEERVHAVFSGWVVPFGLGGCLLGLVGGWKDEPATGFALPI